MGACWQNLSQISHFFPCTHSRTHSDAKFMKIEQILKTLNLKNGLLSNVWWARQDSNLGPIHYECTALTAELQALTLYYQHFLVISKKKST